MAGITVAADKNIRISVMTVAPEDLGAPTVAELEAGMDATCVFAINGTRFSATASDTVTDPVFCEGVNSSTVGADNYEGSVALKLFFDADTKQYDADLNEIFEALRVKRSKVWVAFRPGPEWDTAWAVGDMLSGVFEFETDNPQEPTDYTGDIKVVIPGQVKRARTWVPVAAA